MPRPHPRRKNSRKVPKSNATVTNVSDSDDEASPVAGSSAVVVGTRVASPLVMTTPSQEAVLNDETEKTPRAPNTEYLYDLDPTHTPPGLAELVHSQTKYGSYVYLRYIEHFDFTHRPSLA